MIDLIDPKIIFENYSNNLAFYDSDNKVIIISKIAEKYPVLKKELELHEKNHAKYSIYSFIGLLYNYYCVDFKQQIEFYTIKGYKKEFDECYSLYIQEKNKFPIYKMKEDKSIYYLIYRKIHPKTCLGIFFLVIQIMILLKLLLDLILFLWQSF